MGNKLFASSNFATAIRDVTMIFAISLCGCASVVPYKEFSGDDSATLRLISAHRGTRAFQANYPKCESYMLIHGFYAHKDSPNAIRPTEFPNGPLTAEYKIKADQQFGFWMESPGLSVSPCSLSVEFVPQKGKVYAASYSSQMGSCWLVFSEIDPKTNAATLLKDKVSKQPLCALGLH